MDGLLLLGALANAHARSPVRARTCAEVFAEASRHAGFGATHERSSRGTTKTPRTMPASALADAMARCGSSVNAVFGESLLSAIAVDGEEEGSGDARVDALATAAALSVLCGGALEEKVGLMFRCVDVDGVLGITEDQAMAFARTCAEVLGAALEDAGEGEMELGRCVDAWGTMVRDLLRRRRDDDLGLLTVDDFKDLMARMLKDMGKSSVNATDSEDAREGRAGRKTARLSSSSAHGRTSLGGSDGGGGSFFDAPIVRTGLEYLSAATGHGGASSSTTPANVIASVIPALVRGSQSSPQEERPSVSPSLKAFGSIGSSGVLPSPEKQHRASLSTGSTANLFSSMIPDGIANLLGVKSPHSTRETLKREVGMTDEEWEHAQLSAELEAARKETDETELTQAVEESTWSNVVMLVKEIVIRLFLFNTVKLLLTIALLGGDAALCVYVVNHFGVVAGLGFVVVINVVLSVIFIWFIVTFNKREKGKDNMQFGANIMQSIHDIAKSKTRLDGLLSTDRAESDTDHISPRSWQAEEPTPRAFGQMKDAADERRFRRTVTGTKLGERV